jgi:hypothetical protein
MLHASSRVGVLERYRVPYTVASEARRDDLLTIAKEDGTGPCVLSLRASPGEQARLYRLDGAVLYVELAEKGQISATLRSTGQEWREERPIVDVSGIRESFVYRAADGSVFFPFDIDTPFESLVGERYALRGGAGRLELARDAYYRIRPFVPRPLQLALRRRFRRFQERSPFPAWPAETSLHRLEALLLGHVERIAEEPLPWISMWPAPREWAVVLTHDVEHTDGYENIRSVRSVEERHGLRSAWYLVPERDYRVDDSLLDWLRRNDCEVCLHGLRHDGRDLASGVFESRLGAMREYLERWGARGFRGPATLRNPAFIQRLGVEHDSTWSDVARYEPQPGGSCSWLPFFMGDVVELPITLAMDHTIFEVLGETTDELWREKAGLLREYGGMALMLTHPDYLLEPHRLRIYEQFLGQLGSDGSAWHALPCEVAEWWRDRSRTFLEPADDGWTAHGPGAERAQLRLGAPDPPRASHAT